MTNERLRVLVSVAYYLPGFKAGGPIQTLKNMIESLGDEFEFWLLTADRDLGDTRPYSTVPIDQWHTQGKARVCYLSPAERRWNRWRQRLNELEYDVLYLNSFWHHDSRCALWLRRLGLVPRKPVIVAPRGEFSPGAYRLKAWKKRAYLFAAKSIGLCHDVLWHASNAMEAEHIRALFRVKAKVHCASDMPPSTPVEALAENIHCAPNLPSPLRALPAEVPRRKQPGAARVVLVGRMSRMKNVDYALRVLAQVRGDVDFRVLGPPEDREYDAECRTLAEQLPPGVRATILGAVPPEDVGRELAAAHLMFLPTRGENFGHAIIEALRSGCPVLISDQTPWRGLEDDRAGWILPLDEAERFRAVVQQVIDMPEADWAEWSAGARRFGERFACDPAHVEANRQLFLRAAGRLTDLEPAAPSDERPAPRPGVRPKE